MPLIRPATTADAAGLLEIYRPYVEGTAVSFETETPSVQAFADRIDTALTGWAWLVAEEDGQCDPGAATDGEQAGEIEAFEESPWPDGDPQLVRRHRAPPSRIDSAPRTGEGGDRRRGWRPSPRPPPPWCGRGASRGRRIPR